MIDNVRRTLFTFILDQSQQPSTALAPISWLRIIAAKPEICRRLISIQSRTILDSSGALPPNADAASKPHSPGFVQASREQLKVDRGQPTTGKGITVRVRCRETVRECFQKRRGKGMAHLFQTPPLPPCAAAICGVPPVQARRFRSNAML
jgi:hypothetical protein